MNRLLLIPLFLFATVMSTIADMRYEAVDLQTGAVRITYEIKDSKAGNKVFIFPEGGFIHDATAGTFRVESVFDLGEKREMEYTIVREKDSGLPQVKITYPRKLITGETKTLQVAVIVHMPEALLSRDANGRYIFEYETSHKFEFLVPKNHYVVYTNQPVWFFEKGDSLIVQQLDEKPRKIVIQTRAMK